MATVFLVEDDQPIREALARSLADRGHAVHTSATGLDAVSQILEGTPDVVLLDLGLPDIDGYDLLRMVRAVSAIPIIVVTARDDEAEVVRLLNAGADDYVTKPFSSDHLEARITAVLRRSEAGGTGGRIQVGELVVDLSSRQAFLGHEALELSRKEFDLLAHLASRAGEVVTREELFAEVWRQPFGGADKTLDVHVSWLRKKLGESAAEPRYVHTVRGVGLRIVAPP